MNPSPIPFGSPEGSVRGQTEHPGPFHLLRPGMRYQAADSDQAQRSRAPKGATLFIVD